MAETTQRSAEAGHETREQCLETEAYLPSSGHDTVVGEEVLGEIAVETVECPVCGRQYDYIFDLGHDGLWDQDGQQYTNEADVSPTGSLTKTDEYADGTNYIVELEDEEGKVWERVYHLRSLNHDGDQVASF